MGEHRLNRFDFLHSERGRGSRFPWHQIVLFAALFLSAFVVTVAIVSYPGAPQPSFVAQSRAIRRTNHHTHNNAPTVHRISRMPRVIAHRLVPSPTPRSQILPVRRPLREDQRLLAVAVGARPQAIVSVGGQTRIVTIGDAIAGRIVQAIDIGGIRLSGMSTELRIGR